jgi:hypothetical protein
MPKFKVGDQVERTGPLVPPYMRTGAVIRVIPNEHGLDFLCQYEVEFGNEMTAVLYETQLRLAASNPA